MCVCARAHRKVCVCVCAHRKMCVCVHARARTERCVCVCVCLWLVGVGCIVTTGCIFEHELAVSSFFLLLHFYFYLYSCLVKAAAALLLFMCLDGLTTFAKNVLSWVINLCQCAFFFFNFAETVCGIILFMMTAYRLVYYQATSLQLSESAGEDNHLLFTCLLQLDRSHWIPKIKDHNVSQSD